MSVMGRGVLALRYRRALVRTAVSAAAAGLPVIPGAWWNPDEQRFDCDLPGCTRTGLHPAVPADGGLGSLADGTLAGPGGDGLTRHAVRHPEAVAMRWRNAPYAVLVPTGEACDVVDVPSWLGRSLALELDARSALGPVIQAGRRWFFLTAPGGRLPAPGGDVLVHGHGSWIVLPPSLGPGGEPATWLARPSRGGGWALPRRDAVMAALDRHRMAGLPSALLAAV